MKQFYKISEEELKGWIQKHMIRHDHIVNDLVIRLDCSDIKVMDRTFKDATAFNQDLTRWDINNNN